MTTRREAPAGTIDARTSTLRGERENWNRELAFLRKQAEATDPGVLAGSLIEDYGRFEAAMDLEERDLVNTPLNWTDEDFEVGRWVEGVYHTFSRTAAKVAGKLLAGEPPPATDGPGARMVAVSLAAGGSAIKWAQIADAERRPLQMREIHSTFDMAEKSGLAAVPATLPVRSTNAPTTAATLYARALMLDALCHGNLRRRQAGLIDCWLWEWAPEYALARSKHAGACLRAGPPPERGQRGAKEGEETRLLSIDRLGAHIELASRWLREGRIYPGHGMAAQLRVEDHVVALELLRGFLSASRQKAAARQGRESRIGMVEVLVGLPEILEKGFRVAAGVHTPLLRKAGPSLSDSPDPFARASAVGRHYELRARLMELLDESPGGLGLEFDDSADPLEAGTLLGVSTDPEAPVVPCDVVRRLASPGKRSRLGTRVLGRQVGRVRLHSEKWPAGIDAIFLAGDDESGRGDGLLLATTAYDPAIVHEARLPKRTFRLHLGRIRRQGHGWVIAGLEFTGSPV